MTLTGHPLNDLYPLSLDTNLQVSSKANICWVGDEIPFVVLTELNMVKFCLICRLNKETDVFTDIKPDSRNRQLAWLAKQPQLELKTVFSFNLEQQKVKKAVVTQGTNEDLICVSLLTDLNWVLVFESNLNLNFQLVATFENIASISEICFINLKETSARLISRDIVRLAHSDQFPQYKEIIYFSNCIKNLPDQIVHIDLQKDQLSVYFGGYSLIHSAKHAKVTGMSAIPQQIQLLKDGRLELTYTEGKILCVYFTLRLPCLFVQSITTTFKSLLPKEDFKDYLSRLITLFEQKAGPMFSVFSTNFLWLIGFRTQEQPKFSQEQSTSMFDRLLKITNNQMQATTKLDLRSAQRLAEINKILKLLMEECKLDRNLGLGTQQLADLIVRVDKDLQASQIVSKNYDFQNWCLNMNTSFPIVFERTRIISRVYEVLNQKGAHSYFAIQSMNQEYNQLKFIDLNMSNLDKLQSSQNYKKNDYWFQNDNKHVFEQILTVLCQENFLLNQIRMLPFQIQLTIHEILVHLRSNAEQIRTFEWPNSFFVLISREDILSNQRRNILSAPPTDAQDTKAPKFEITNQLSFKKEAKNAKQLLSSETYVQNLIGTQFDQNFDKTQMRSVGLSSTLKDSRFQEVEFLLRSDVQMRIKESSQAGELNEEQTMANQKLQLDKIFRRQLSKCIGRGAVQLGTEETLPTEKLDIPLISASAIVQKPTIQTVDTEISNQPVVITVDIKSKEEKEMMQWPDFHNGVASALKIQKQSFGQINAKNSRNWIMYHRPVVPKNEHGGFLLGLGLLGQLDSLQPTDLYQHLKIAHESTTIGILLGRGASKLGKMDESDSRMMCLHIPALLPPNLSVEYSLSVQSAAVVASGLLYLQTNCRSISEMLLSQIAKKPNTDKLIEREGYSFAAGLSLGLVNLASDNPAENKPTQVIQELELDERLVRFVQGGKQLPLPRSMLSQIQLNENAKSSAVKETDQINTHITAPGALAALALIYLKSNNSSIAKRIEVPQSFIALDSVTPLNLILRVITRNLILWVNILNTPAWITSQIPDFIRLVYECNNQNSLNKELKYKIGEKEVDYAAISQSYANIKAASVLSIGFKYAGTSDLIAKETVLGEINWFRKKVQTVVAVQPLGGPIQTNTSFATKNQIDKTTIEKCLCMCALALGMIMAGSCDVESFKILRVLRKRFESEMNFGHNQAINQAIGMVFLAQGQYTFSRTNKAIAGLFCSVYPVFPQSPSDNRHYLQALRHFYVFALETRLLQARDIDTGDFVKVQVQVETLVDGILQTSTLSTPQIVNGQIQSIRIQNDDCYHDLILQVEGQGMMIDQQKFAQIGEFEKTNLWQVLYVKRKTFSQNIKRTEPVTESLQSILKSTGQKEQNAQSIINEQQLIDRNQSDQLNKAAVNSLAGLQEVSDPLVSAFFKTFAQQKDASTALASIMSFDTLDYFELLARVQDKTNKFCKDSIQHNLVQLYEAYLNDKIDSLPILLSNLRLKLSSIGVTKDTIIEQQHQSTPISNQSLATSIIDQLVQIGDQKVVQEYLNALKNDLKLTELQLEIDNALKMCGVEKSQVKDIAIDYSK